jgi:hypothetical protein
VFFVAQPGESFMAKTSSKFGFVECADLVSEQKYGAALRQFQTAAQNFIESKSPPKRGEIAQQLLQIGMALEETLKRAMGEKWDAHVPRFEENTEASCSFCGKNQTDVRKLIAGPSVHICDECVDLCKNIFLQEAEAAETKSGENRLCGICMEARESDELIFLPHAAYMCAGCLEDLQNIRDRHGENK